MKNNIKITLKEFLNETYIDSDGNLKDFEQKIFYDFDKIGKFVEWFGKEYNDYTFKQGWDIFDSDTEEPNDKYHSERKINGKRLSGYFWQVQRLDEPEDGEALFGKLHNDSQAEDLARKLGLMVDEYGIVYGWKGKTFL